MAALSISAICLITKEGFASDYYVAYYLIILIVSGSYYITPKLYTLIVISVFAQHFFLLSFLPCKQSLMLFQFVTLALFAIAGIFIHKLIYSQQTQIKILEGYLPICSKCKKIRDNKGAWHQIEMYVRQHSKAEFTHTLCTECVKEIYGTDHDEPDNPVKDSKGSPT